MANDDDDQYFTQEEITMLGDKARFEKMGEESAAKDDNALHEAVAQPLSPPPKPPYVREIKNPKASRSPERLNERQWREWATHQLQALRTELRDHRVSLAKRNKQYNDWNISCLAYYNDLAECLERHGIGLKSKGLKGSLKRISWVKAALWIVGGLYVLAVLSK